MPPSIPQNALFIVMENLSNPSMGEYMRLAQVSRDFRSAFLSNAAWAKFDVHGVQDDIHVYRHGGYELRGIAAHFYNHLISCDPPMRAWGFNKVRRDDGPMLIASVSALDRYSQLNALTLFDEIREPCDNFKKAVLERVPLIALDVWKLWATHLREPMDGPLEDFDSALPATVARDKQVVLALLQQQWIPSGSDVVGAFDNERDINLLLAAQYISHEVGRRLPSPRFLRDADFVLEALHFADSDCAETDLRSIVSHQWHHKAIVLKLVTINGYLLKHASEELRADREIALAEAKWSWPLIGAAETLKYDRGFLLEAVKVNGANLRWAPWEFRGDREIVLAAVKKTVKNNGDGAIQHASAELQNDRQVVLEAVKHDRNALQYASAELKNDREVVLEAVKHSGNALQYASAELKNDRHIVLEAVKSGADTLKFASAELRNDRQVVLEAVSSGGYALRYASAELRTDRQVVLKAVKHYVAALQYASADLKNDRQVMLEALKQSGCALEYASEALRADGIIVLAAVGQDLWAFRYASAALRGDRKFVFPCLKLMKSLYEWPDSFSLYEDFWYFVSDEVRSDRNFALQMIAKGVLSLSYLPRDLSNDQQLVLCAVKNDPSELFYAPHTLRHDHDFMLCVVRQNGDALRWVGPELQADKKLVFNAVWQSRSALRYASQELRNDPDIQTAARGKRTHPSS